MTNETKEIVGNLFFWSIVFAVVVCTFALDTWMERILMWALVVTLAAIVKEVFHE